MARFHQSSKARNKQFAQAQTKAHYFVRIAIKYHHCRKTKQSIEARKKEALRTAQCLNSNGAQHKRASALICQIPHQAASTKRRHCFTPRLLIAAGALILLMRAPRLSQQQQLHPRSYSAGSLASEVPNYGPVLIGYRCESCSREVAQNGANIMEANTPVKLTLFGELFTTNTIVGFTYEFLLDDDLPTAAADQAVEQSAQTATMQPLPQPDVNDTQSGQGQPQQQVRRSGGGANSKLSQQRRAARSFDCTDYDRVRSYKLTEANIVSPNVAQLTVSLPEPFSADMYYYFCLKQAPSGDASSPLAASDGNASAVLPYVWVHQGDDWFVSLKVEPPILTATFDCLLIVFLLFLSAVTSGLNLGLMSLDMNELAVIGSCGDQRERSYARAIMPLRKRGNYLLCSLLLGNVLVNSTLTVILEDLTSGLVAIIGSTLAIVVLGEIVPQAFCARKGLAIGAKTIYLTYAFMIVTFPLSYPISRLLDCVLGEETGNVYDRERLMEFIKITGHHTQLEADEVAIISGALKLKKIKVDQIMTRIEDVFMLPIDCKLDRDTIKTIIQKGYSRIPVYELGDRRQIVALILAKDLALLDPDDHTPVANMLMYCKHPLIFISDDTTLDVALNEFKTGKSHMAVVRQIYDDGEIDKYFEATGVVTLEDVIEEVLQVEINDETDTLSDNRRKRRRTDAQVAHLIDEPNSASPTSADGLPLQLAQGKGQLQLASFEVAAQSPQSKSAGSADSMQHVASPYRQLSATALTTFATPTSAQPQSTAGSAILDCVLPIDVELADSSAIERTNR